MLPLVRPGGPAIAFTRRLPARRPFYGRRLAAFSRGTTDCFVEMVFGDCVSPPFRAMVQKTMTYRWHAAESHPLYMLP